jgi:hypothetical protein
MSITLNLRYGKRDGYKDTFLASRIRTDEQEAYSTLHNMENKLKALQKNHSNTHTSISGWDSVIYNSNMDDTTKKIIFHKIKTELIKNETYTVKFSIKLRENDLWRPDFLLGYIEEIKLYKKADPEMEKEGYIIDFEQLSGLIGTPPPTTQPTAPPTAQTTAPPTAPPNPVLSPKLP